MTTQSHNITDYISITFYFIITVVVNHFGICLCPFYNSKRTYAPRFTFWCFLVVSEQLKQLENKTKYRETKGLYCCMYYIEAIPKVTAPFDNF